MGSFYVGLVNFVASPYEKLHLERQMFISGDADPILLTLFVVSE
jgi:hypothetical protein